MSEKVCSVEGCGRGVRTRGLCSAHYKRLWRGRDISTPIQERPAAFTVCTVPGCGGAHVARGYCKRHLERFYRWGDPTVVYPKGKPGQQPVSHAMRVAQRLAQRGRAA